MSTDVIQKPRPSGDMRTGTIVSAAPVIGNYGFVLDLIIANGIESSVYDLMTQRLDQRTYYPPREH